jgi:hypothetical protein
VEVFLSRTMNVFKWYLYENIKNQMLVLNHS